MIALDVVDAEQLRRLLPVESALDALESAFRTGRLPQAPLRTRLDAPGGEMLLMPATGPQGAGVKVVTLAPGNPARGLPLIHAVYLLFDRGSLALRAVIEGAALTTVRTAAVSALATRYLARRDASRLVIFGAGVQGNAHLDAMLAVSPIERVTVVSRSPEPARRLAGRASALGLAAGVGEPEAVAEADLVCTCTTSETPVFAGRLLAAGAHVNAVGGHQPGARELDDQTVRRARLVVETREAAMAEAGDLLGPIRAGVIGPDHVVADLAEVVAGAPVRRGPEDITVFKSVGVAFEDLVVARAAAGRLGAAAPDPAAG